MQLIICVCATPSAISAQGSLSVTVLDQRSTPLSGAQILVDELSRGGSTDEGGSATVSDVAAGSYTVRVTLIGYSPDSRVVVVVDGENLAHHLRPSHWKLWSSRDWWSSVTAHVPARLPDRWWQSTP